MSRPFLVAAALGLDALIGEPPEAVHPTVWIGKTIAFFERWTDGVTGARSRVLAGGVLAAGLPLLSAGLCAAALRRAPARPLAEALLVSTTLSLRGLARAAVAVEEELRGGDLARARERAGEIVGRDTSGLKPGEVGRAAIESVAENTSDGIVAPALYGLLFGAPGAVAYRAINTLDSMVGHPDPPYRDLGLASARLDDLANFVPARLTALAVAAVSGAPVSVFRVCLRYAPLTRSPNAGWPEAAFAGALDLRLGGVNVYGGLTRTGPFLGDGRMPHPDDISRAVRLMRRCCAFLLAVACGAYVVRRG